MSGYTRFDRHANMSVETLSEIGSILREVDFTQFELTNQLYGLYDGYLYDELLVNAQDLPKQLYRRIIRVWAVVSKYPKLQYIAGVLYDVDEADVEALEYYEGMGVAEGKRYLATI
jgi:hypothetical protein